MQRRKYCRNRPRPMMTCGCIADGFIIIDGVSYYSCSKHGNFQVERDTDDPITDRVARCDYCETTVPSSWSLVKFRHEPNYAEDRFYCGCRGAHA